MKFRTQFFTLIMSLFIVTAGVNSFVLSGDLKAHENESSDENHLPRQFYDYDDYEEQENTPPEQEEQENTPPEQEEQKNAQPEDEDLTADTELLFDREKKEPQSKAAQVEKVEIKLNAELIKKIQTALNQKIKAGLAVDGVWGKKTDKAVKKFQQANGLKTDLDKATLDKLGVTTRNL